MDCPDRRPAQAASVAGLPHKLGHGRGRGNTRATSLRSRTCGGLTLRSNNTFCLSTKRPVRASLPQRPTENLRHTGIGLPSAPKGSPLQSRLCRLKGSGKAAFVPLRSMAAVTLGPLPTSSVDQGSGP